MNNVLNELLPSNKALKDLRKDYLEKLTEVAQDKNRLRVFYQLVLLAECSLQVAEKIDFSDFLSGMQEEIITLKTKTEKCVKENNAHYKWSSEVKAHVFEESADKDAITRIDGEIKALLQEFDRLLSRQVQEEASKNFDTVADSINAK